MRLAVGNKLTCCLLCLFVCLFVCVVCLFVCFCCLFVCYKLSACLQTQRVPLNTHRIVHGCMLQNHPMFDSLPFKWHPAGICSVCLSVCLFVCLFVCLLPVVPPSVTRCVLPLGTQLSALIVVRVAAQKRQFLETPLIVCLFVCLVGWLFVCLFVYFVLTIK